MITRMKLTTFAVYAAIIIALLLMALEVDIWTAVVAALMCGMGSLHHYTLGWRRGLREAERIVAEHADKAAAIARDKAGVTNEG